jgi:GntR family transcriptional regulator
MEYPVEMQREFEEGISAGRYTPGTRVTAAELGERSGLGADRAARVLAAAHRKGLVIRSAEGGESFIVQGVPRSSRQSVFTHTAEAGFRPTSLVRDVEIEPAACTVAEKLRVDEGSPVYRYVRTRYVDGRPLANQINYMPLEVCPGLEHDDVSWSSFQRLLEDKYRAILVDMEERFLLEPATGEDRTVLELPEGSEVLVIERVALSATGWPLVWANIRIRPDRYSYVAALWPAAAQLLTAPEP